MKQDIRLDSMMEVMPATLLATTPFSHPPARIALSAVERTVTSIRYKKEWRASTSIKRRSAVNQKHSNASERQSRKQSRNVSQSQSDQYQHCRRLSSLERRVDFRPLGRVSDKQLEMLTKTANEVMEEMWKDAGIVNPPKPSTAPAGNQEDLQLPKITEPKPSDTSSTKSSRSSPSDSRKDSGNEEESVKQQDAVDGIQRVRGKSCSRVDMVKNLQKHRKSLSAPVADRAKSNKPATKSERRQRCSTSKVDSVSWGDSEGMVRGKASVKVATSSVSSNGSDDDTKRKKVRNRDKLPPAKERKPTKEIEETERPTRSAFFRLPRVENKPIDVDVDLSTATLEDVILARLEDDDNGGDKDSDSCNSKEHRVHWEGNECGYNSDTIACTTRPTSSETDERKMPMRSEIATPELSEGALSNDEGDRCVSAAKNRRKTMKHSSAMLKDMNGNLSNKDHTHGDDIAESVMKKLQPAHPHVIWPENRFMTSNTVFVYGSPSQLAPVIVPSHSLDCPLCNFFKSSPGGGICPPNSPTSFMKKDYGFYPVERFYSEF
ncbi:uncharacterized protein LOC121422944 [Lytechinus variegatus]|uniref:uncharacterized protein LOC121422944 n=1 Tax=Lytechinus variegatus TaxID=7654 RepID=UPI001BB2A6A7|nr:uncharacterized protein LOC121422944 [Lytechinus variegatus]